MNRLKKTLALSSVGALMSIGVVAAAATPASATRVLPPAGPAFAQYAPCYPLVNVANYNKRAMTIEIDGMDDVRVPANTGIRFTTELSKLRWSAVVGKGKNAVDVGSGVFRVNADCPS